MIARSQMEETFEITRTDIKNAFYKWVKNFRENPDGFMSIDIFGDLPYEETAILYTDAFVDYIKSNKDK